MTLRPVLVSVALTTAATALSTPAAHAGDPGPAAVATIQTVDPAVPAPGGDLVLAGTVVNTGDELLSDVNAILRFSAVPLDDRVDVRRVATDNDLRWGQRDADFFHEVDPELAPGETAEFVLSIPVDEINFGDPGVYAIGVDIRATPADGERLTLATTRTVVPWLPDAEALAAVPVALLWPLATEPALLPDGTLLTDGMADQLGPDGTLTTLVEAPGSAPVTWVVDPDLLTTVATMTDGYGVTTPDGTTTEGAGAADAESWQEAYAAATDGDQPFLLPYANPDLPAIASAGEDLATESASEALDATREWARRAGVTGAREIAWPGSGVADDATLAALASAGAHSVVLSADAVEPSTDAVSARVRTGSTTLEAVITDDGLEAAIDAALGPDPSAGVTALRQAWLAETALVALAADDETPVAQPLVAAPPYGWQPSAAVAKALVEVWTMTPWVRPAALADLPAPVQGTQVRLDSAASATPPQLPPANVAAATDLQRASASYAALLAEPEALTAALPLSTLRAVATAWRAAPEAAATYAATATAMVSSRLSQVAVLIPESVTLSGDKGTFPLTVSNGLPQPVLVSVDVQADYPDRMSVADVPPQRVNAGENATVEVTAEATANGKVPVTVRLTAADGSSLGPPQQMIVNATDYGAIGWIVVIAAVFLFATAAVLRLIRARRRPVPDIADQGETAATPEPLRETAR
ncbi:MAG: DUF6049 family protein [Jiangellaceae bacterium]